MLTHALQYRQAMKEKRQAAVAIVALEAFTKDMLLRRRDVKKLVKKDKTATEKQNEANAAAAAAAAARHAPARIRSKDVDIEKGSVEKSEIFQENFRKFSRKNIRSGNFPKF